MCQLNNNNADVVAFTLFYGSEMLFVCWYLEKAQLDKIWTIHVWAAKFFSDDNFNTAAFATQ